ncbi:helicase-related protein [Veronia pacifica]|uniref:DEAD/DEAH box helicase n=1 Tax=Veronia pacifica TaxID=1080227 RepID=A0A1C3ECJ0_9GAMM|nr:helicase-related protein [Veronia pacifica]ODA30953.1 DEAD/DEAH box helicase [Veronia pacifica]
MNNFPIEKIKSHFLQALPSTNLVIQAETGTGKSTHLPVWASKHGRVLVIEPRRIACTSLAGFVAETLDSRPGEKVGYAIKFAHQYTDETDVVFVTPGVALRWFSENRLGDFDIVMLDEFHERRIESDLLAGLLLKHAQHRLIVTSATLDSDKLSRYFSAEVIKAEGKSYSVTISYSAKDSSHMPSIRDLENRVAEAVNWALEDDGDVLVFLPGRKEISSCMGQLRQCGAELVQLHAGVSDQERQRALTTSDRQKVVLATNVAETSLTIPDIVTVIDSGLERRTHQRNGRTVLALHAISKASARQRTGRAGRVRPGHCIRLYGEFAPLESYTPPELEREELTDTMLASACCGYELESLSLLSRLPLKSVSQATDRLLAMKAIDNHGLATAHGKALYPLPIDSLFAHLISGMETKGSREAMIDLAAVIQTPQTLWRLPSTELAFDHYKAWNSSMCDAVTNIAVLRGEQVEAVNVDSDVQDEARKVSSAIRQALDLPHWQAATKLRRDEWLKNVICQAPELVYVRREKRQQAFTNGYSEVLLGRDSLFADEYQAAIVFGQFHLAGKRGAKQTSSYATCMAPIPLQWIRELGLSDCTSAGTVEQENEQLEVVEHTYAGRVIHREYRKPEGEGLLVALAELILNGKHFAFGESLKTSIEYWNLYQQVEADAPLPAIEPLEWIKVRLTELGVETKDDLTLVDASDFEFDGIPDWEYEGFCEKYPLTVTLSDLQLKVEYFKARRTVMIHHVGGKRKADPKRWELPRWQGWKVQYRKASRLVDIK